jgi:hypothetical protein
MDQDRFDDFTRAVRARTSRRSALGLFAGLGVAGAPDAAAKRKTCKGKKRCGTKCIARKTCCTKGAKGCPFTEVCEQGACVDCFGQECSVADDCCTGVCDAGAVCTCKLGNTSCTSDRNCCNGACNAETGLCRCDPIGSLCSVAVTSCCSGTCGPNGTCVA